MSFVAGMISLQAEAETNLSIDGSNNGCAYLHTDHKRYVDSLVAEQGLQGREQHEDGRIHIAIPGGNRRIFNELNDKSTIKIRKHSIQKQQIVNRGKAFIYRLKDILCTV